MANEPIRLIGRLVPPAEALKVKYRGNKTARFMEIECMARQVNEVAMFYEKIRKV